MNLTNPFDTIDQRRRQLLGASAAAAVAATFGAVVPARAATPRPAAGGADPFASLKQIDAGPLSVGYADIGPASGKPVLLFHG
jgi:hypothetical protein